MTEVKEVESYKFKLSDNVKMLAAAIGIVAALVGAGFAAGRYSENRILDSEIEDLKALNRVLTIESAERTVHEDSVDSIHNRLLAAERRLLQNPAEEARIAQLSRAVDLLADRASRVSPARTPELAIAESTIVSIAERTISERSHYEASISEDKISYLEDMVRELEVSMYDAEDELGEVSLEAERTAEDAAGQQERCRRATELNRASVIAQECSNARADSARAVILARRVEYLQNRVSALSAEVSEARSRLAAAVSASPIGSNR